MHACVASIKSIKLLRAFKTVKHTEVLTSILMRVINKMFDTSPLVVYREEKRQDSIVVVPRMHFV